MNTEDGQKWRQMYSLNRCYEDQQKAPPTYSYLVTRVAALLLLKCILLCTLKDVGVVQ